MDYEDCSGTIRGRGGGWIVMVVGIVGEFSTYLVVRLLEDFLERTLWDLRGFIKADGVFAHHSQTSPGGRWGSGSEGFIGRRGYRTCDPSGWVGLLSERSDNARRNTDNLERCGRILCGRM